MPRMRRLALIAALVAGLAAPAWADFDDGWAAYERGDNATALREWRPLAEQGHAAAQYNLGLMYDNGEGVAQDDGKAVKWYRLAAEQGQGEEGAASVSAPLCGASARGESSPRGMPSSSAWPTEWPRLRVFYRAIGRRAPARRPRPPPTATSTAGAGGRGRDNEGWHDDERVRHRGKFTADHGNLKPAKPHKLARIDGIVALIIAIGGHMKAPAKPRSLYEERGLVFM